MAREQNRHKRTMARIGAELCVACGQPGRTDEMHYSSDAEGWFCEPCQAETKEVAKEMFEQLQKRIAEIRAEQEKCRP